MARWLAALAVLFDILAPLLVLLPRTRAADPISILLLPGPVYITPNISLDIHTFLVSAVTVLIGMRASFAVVVRRYAAARGLDE